MERLRSRLRAVAAAVAGAPRRPRVLSLEGITPLVLGAPPPPWLSACLVAVTVRLPAWRPRQCKCGLGHACPALYSIMLVRPPFCF